MGAPCFPQPNLWLARCASMSWTALKKFVVLSTHELRTGKKHSFHCGRKAWQVLSVLRLRRLLCLFRLVLRRLAVCAVLRDGDGGDGDGGDGEHSDTTALCDRNVSFQPARNIPSLCWGLPPVPPVSAKQGDRDCYFLFRQNVCTSGRSSSRRKQQQQQEEATAAAAGGSSSSRRKQ